MFNKINLKPDFYKITIGAMLIIMALLMSACSNDDSNGSGDNAGKIENKNNANVKFNSINITGVDYAKNFNLTDHNGEKKSLENFKGKIVIMFFGFTQCPDVCPTSMLELAELKRLLGADGDKIQGLFVTVDPERDTQQVLKAYMENFDPNFLALVPTIEELPVLAKEFKIYYKKIEGRSPTSYTMDHSAGNYVYDKNGKLRLYMRYGSALDKQLEDIKQLLKD